MFKYYNIGIKIYENILNPVELYTPIAKIMYL